ncbi:MAG: hypothetical protein A2161_03125 [Candidatus Schekmanbacteria bacterium RBG_13_48_7]|uniref:Uncharacterized protein n=1 Tax=Candidatus Schekmanbacteria bacterium RBG_13_48_7 TaxID=1817878 RepID=A0A1F7RXY8_9BACT|nr:MAG: hypothetical protein A2161_03125 [Candidatus Schekmanbacteria bacterium RBG_13_48_7]
MTIPRNTIIQMIMDAMTKEEIPGIENLKPEEFLKLKVKDLQLDIPPLPSDTNFAKKSLTIAIKWEFIEKNHRLILSWTFFQDENKSMKDLVDRCEKYHFELPKAFFE